MHRLSLLALGGLLAVLTACGPEEPTVSSACPGCNVLLITLDTVEASRLPCYGNPADTAPNICALAEEGILFADAMSQSSWTLPSHASILTGRYPNQHGAETRQTRLGDDVPRLPRILARENYATGAIVSQRFLDRTFGFRKGFQFFDNSLIEGGNRGSFAQEVSDKAISWLEERNGPFFLWLHYFDPHNAFLRHDNGFEYPTEADGESLKYKGWNNVPATNLEYFRDNREALVALHEGEIHFTDLQIGRVIEHLTHSGSLESTIVIVTADHGEAFGTHEQFGHGSVLYDELVRVPLIVRMPGLDKPHIVATPQETKDIFHTVLSLLGLESPAASGYNLLTDHREYAFSEVVSRKHDKRVAIVNERWKLVYTLDKMVELYDRAEDPGEKSNVAERHPEVVKDLLARLTEEMNIVILDEEALEQLRALGYVN